MSRAFVNEDNAAAQADQPVERQVSEQPNRLTAQGLAQLQAKVAQLQQEYSAESAKGEHADKQRQADLERDLRYFNQRADTLERRLGVGDFWLMNPAPDQATAQQAQR